MRALLSQLAPLLLLSVPGPVRAQPDFPDDSIVLSLLAESARARPNAAIVVGMLEPDGRRRALAAGVAAEGASRPLDEHTVCEIGSITKVFTGVLLVELP